MDPNKYNPKAREAFGRSLIDVGVGIFKAIMLFFTTAPLGILLTQAMDGKTVSLGQLWAFIMSPAYWLFLVILAFSWVIAHYLRKEGLRHLHELEQT